MTTYNKDGIGLQEAKDLPTYSVRAETDPTTITFEVKKIIEKNFPEVGLNYGWRRTDTENLFRVFGYPNDPDRLNIPDGLFYLKFRKPLPKPKTRLQIAKETLQGIIKEFDIPDPEMSSFTINQMKYAQDHATIDAIEKFLDWYFGSEDWRDRKDLQPDAGNLFDLKLGEYSYCQNFEKIKVETLEETKYWVLNGKHTNELECGRTLVFTNFDPDESNGVDYEEFLFSYLTYVGVSE